ncbi:MAG: hypothetical protein HQ519_09505 [Planctomycetes bacterium]|nr:hypothetical protein [Planctomycetota bacterium]
MIIFISALTTLLSAVLPGQLQQSPEMPAGLPHPTVPQSVESMQDLIAGHKEMQEKELWHQAQPGGLLTGSLDSSFAAARQERGDVLASLGDWNAAELREWLSLTAPKPIQLTYSISQISLTGDESRTRVLNSGSQPLIPGELYTLGSQSSMPVIRDMDVEIASGSSIADPFINLQFQGISLGIAIVPIDQNRWWAEIGLSMSEALKAEKIETGNDEIWGKGREAIRLLEFSGPILMDARKTTEIHLPGLAPNTKVVIQMALQANSASPAHQAGRFLAIDLPTAALDPEMGPIMDGASENFAWASPLGMVVLEAEGAEMIAEELIAAAGGVSGVNLSLSMSGATGATPVQLLQIPAVLGRDYHLAVGEAFDCLVDWEVEVASESRIPDPTYTRHFDGLAGRIRADASSGVLDQTELDLIFTSVEMGKPTSLKLGGEMLPNMNSQPRMAAVLVNVERPLVLASHFRWSGQLTSVEIQKSMPSAFGFGSKATLRLQAVAIAND